MKNTYGYIRVSSIDQNEKRQVIALEEQGISMKNIYVDKMSGKNFDRPQYWKLIKKLHKGDTLCVTSIDRLEEIMKKSKTSGECSQRKKR